jgi:hypothetical protein
MQIEPDVIVTRAFAADCDVVHSQLPTERAAALSPLLARRRQRVLPAQGLTYDTLKADLPLRELRQPSHRLRRAWSLAVFAR